MVKEFQRAGGPQPILDSIQPLYTEFRTGNWYELVLEKFYQIIYSDKVKNILPFRKLVKGHL